MPLAKQNMNSALARYASSAQSWHGSQHNEFEDAMNNVNTTRMHSSAARLAPEAWEG